MLKETHTLVKRIGAFYGYRMGNDRSKLEGQSNLYEKWWWVGDTVNNTWYTIGAHLGDWEQLREQKRGIFFMRAHVGKKENPVFDSNPEILKSLGFLQPHAEGYFYLPLSDSDDHTATAADSLAKKIIKVLHDVRDVIAAFGVK